MHTLFKEDLDNLFGPMFEEYYEQKSSDMPIYSAAQPTQVHEDSPSTSSIIVDTHEAPPAVTTTDEQTSPISLPEADELNQEDTAEFDGNAQFVPYNPSSHEEIESSTMAFVPSNVQEFPTKISLIFQLDVKRAFLNGPLKEVYVCPTWKGLLIQNFQIHVRQLKKKLYTVLEALSCMYDKLSSFLIEHGFTKGLDECVSMSTPMATERLDTDLHGTSTDQTTYRRMIGGLMYITASRPDIAFATFICARYQARPTVIHPSIEEELQFLSGKLCELVFKKQDLQSDSDVNVTPIIIMVQQQHAADVHPDELCPPNKRYDLMDANKKVDLDHVQSSSSVPWIYMAQFWPTLKEDGSKYRLRFMLDKTELTLTLDDFRQIFHLPQATANNHNSFVPPPSFFDMVPVYKKVWGFTMELKTQSNFKTTGLLQPWQTLCKIFSKCLTTRVTGWDQPLLQIMQILYCFVNNIYVDYAELLWEGLYYLLHHLTSSIPYPRFTKIIISHYMTIFPDISRRARDMYHNLQDDDIMKNIFNSGRHKNKVGMQILAWMITDEMKQTKHYRMYTEVFGIDVHLNQSQPTESTDGTHMTTSAPRSPNPGKEATESSAPRRSTVIRLRIPERRSTRLTPPAPVPTVDKADEMILQDTLQVSLAEHKSRKEQEARENVALVDEHLTSEEIEKMVDGQENIVDDSSIPRNDEPNIPDTRIEPRSDKESPKVEIAKEKEVEISKEKEVELTNVVIPVNVNDEDEETTDEESPRIHTNLVSSDTEKLQELTDTPHTTSSSSSPHKKLAKMNRLLSLFKTKPTRFKRYKSFFHKLQGRYGYLFAHLRARFMPRKSFDTLSDNLHDVMVETLPAMVNKHIKEQVVKQVPEQVRNQVPVYVAEGFILERQKAKEETERLIAKAILQELDASVRSYMSGHILHVHLAQSQTSSVSEQQYQLYLSMKADPQLQQQDIAIWLALQIKFERNTVLQTACRTPAVRPRDQDDPHDDAHPEGENSAKRQKTSEYEAYVSGESSSGQVFQEEQAPSTLGNQEQNDDFDIWTDSYASDDDEIQSKQVSQEIMEEVSLTIDEAKLRKMADEIKEILVSLHPRKTTPLVHSCQRDPEAPALSLINQDLLYLKKGNSGPEKIVLSLHKFLAIIFNDDVIEERTSRWVNKCVKKFNPYARYGVKHWKNPHAKIFYIRKQKELGKPKEEIYSNSKIVQVIKTYWELGHEHKFITEIVARRANDCIVSITEPDYKNLNKNDIEDIYLLIMNGKVPDYADTGLLWFLLVFIRSSVIWERVYDFQLGIESYQQKVNLTVPTMTFPGIKDHETFFIIYEHVRGIIFKNSKKEKRVMRHSKIYKFCDATLNRVLEGLKSYNNYVKYGYVQKDLTKDETEYLKLFKEEIEERLKHRRQMRRWEMYVNGRPLGSRRERPE
ncbi:hypothetical protein Tco_0516798 [Tanacetum coccineum]